MTAPSITTPHVRGRGVSMTQSKSHSHGRIYIGLFHSSTGSSPLPASFSPALLCSCWCLSFIPAASLPFTFTFFFCMCVCVLTIEMSSLSSMEHGITSQVVWFNTAVHSCRRASKMLAKKNVALVLISIIVSLCVLDFHSFQLKLCSFDKHLVRSLITKVGVWELSTKMQVCYI